MIKQYFTQDRLYYFKKTLSSPSDCFYEIRYREQGSVPLALITVFIFSVCYTMDKIFAGFIVNTVDPRDVNGLFDFAAIFLIVFLFSIGNWSITCLMGGEGRFKDILTVTGYSLIPLIITFIPAIIISNGLAANEDVFYFIILGFGLVWTAVLILIGIMTVHNYTLVKTFATLFLTFLAMFLIIFLALLLFDLLNQVIIFFENIYIELVARG
ncbi:MAG: YIP1 family protein [Oscillospiraceae bacterium]|nr:YIP1 family protein [Oscillospiraceae bacterium]